MTDLEPLKKMAVRWIDARTDDEASAYLESWKGRGKTGHADLVLFWDTPDMLSHIAAYCYEHNIVMQPRGGGTSLNDSVRPPTDDEDDRVKVVLVSLYKQIEIFEEDGLVRVGAAVTPFQLNEILAQKGMVVKGCDTGAKENSQFGAMFTTNTGGSTAEVEGSLLNNVVGMRAVMADGQVLDDLRLTPKDNASANLTKMIGYLHFPVVLVTDLMLKLSPITKQREAIWIGIDSVEVAHHVRRFLVDALADMVISIEMIEAGALHTVFEHTQNVRNPLSGVDPITLYVQVVSPMEREQFDLTSILQEILVAMIDQLGDKIDASKVVMAQDQTQADNFHHIRHHITISASMEAKSKGATIKGYDISVPLSAICRVMQQLDELMQIHLPGAQVRRFGHFLGGRFHNNVQIPDDTDVSQIEAFSHGLDDIIASVNGSIASEHAPGRDLVSRLPRIRPHVYRHMQAFKKHFDPKCLIAPGVGVAKQ